MINKARISVLATVVGVPLSALTIGACGGSSAATPTPPETAGGRAATVGVESDGTLGKVLVDSRGRTVYLFRRDSGSKSTCVSACASAWPPLRANGKPVAGPGLAASKLGTSARSDGKPQVTYNDHPLYRYTGDRKPGDTNGQGLSAFGAAWYTVSGAGNVVSRPASKPSGGGGVY
jgi:predicted lipoprotein with Yx(FWY)xxD motif